jgi:cytochrome c oxidase assembly protein subunit 15
MLLWNYLKFTNNPTFLRKEYFPKYILTTFLILILLQISVGALVSGLDAGQIYQTWPLMNQYYFPDDSKINELFSFKSFEIASLVQFMHRNLAYLIFSLFLIILLIIFKNKNYNYLKKTAFYVFVFLFLQVFLGILTILSGAHIIVASAHQVCSIFLVTFSLILIFKNSKIN